MSEDYFKKLIDKRLTVKLMIDNLTEELKGIDQEIWDECEVGEVLLGSDGYGYKLTETEILEYGPLAVAHIKKLGLVDEFVKISSTGLEKLVKAKKLSYADLDLLKSRAKVKLQKRIVQFIPEEAKVIA